MHHCIHVQLTADHKSFCETAQFMCVCVCVFINPCVFMYNFNENNKNVSGTYEK